MGPRGPPGPPGKPGDDVSTPASIKGLPHLERPGERGCWVVMGICTLNLAQGAGLVSWETWTLHHLHFHRQLSLQVPLGTALDPLGREIIKTSLAPGREIEKEEKGEGKHKGKDAEKEKQKRNTQQPKIILIVNELGKAKAESGCLQGM